MKGKYINEPKPHSYTYKKLKNRKKVTQVHSHKVENNLRIFLAQTTESGGISYTTILHTFGYAYMHIW